MTEHLDLADLLVIAELVLATPAEDLAKTRRPELPESASHAPAAGFDGVEFYPDLATKTAVLCTHLAKNHPLMDGNKRLAFMAMIEFLTRNGYEWNPPEGDEDGIVTDQMIRQVAA
ncbi:MAG TPA: type II toxin-antitoxin system death-on-curing family toxin [Pseudonocardiaceae bacterium]|nr:type II toxin-antitoxin system death-on-curing family toxin [Pseudonocardiaceae bacterium]